MSKKEWTVRIKVPKLGINTKYRVTGTYPWTAMTRGFEAALEEAGKKIGLLRTTRYGEHVNTWEFRKMKLHEHLEGVSVQIIETPKQRKDRLKKEAALAAKQEDIEPAAILAGF